MEAAEDTATQPLTQNQESKTYESLFPVDISLEDCREAIRGRTEFVEKQQGNLIIFNYQWCTKRTFPDPNTAPDARTAHLLRVRRECRGLVFDSTTGKVIARRFHKFFNIGELPETQEDKLPLDLGHVVLTKFDGSLVSPLLDSSGTLQWATKGGASDVADVLTERFLKYTKLDYDRFAKEWLQQGWTPLFEWCSPRTRIVLKYDTDMLVLIALRNNRTGAYLPHPEVEKAAEPFGIPVTPALQSGLVLSRETLKEWMANIKATPGIEGFVIRFDNGAMYKVKTDWYFERTKKEKQQFSFNSERNIWTMIVEQQIDDALSMMSDPVLEERVRAFEEQLWSAIEETANRLSAYVQPYKGQISKRDFVQQVTKDGYTDGLTRAVLFHLFDAPDTVRPIEIVLKSVKGSLGSASALENARTLLGGSIRFTEG